MNDFIFKIVSYNAHKGFNISNTKFVLAKMRSALIDVNADVLLLQEIQGQHKYKKFKTALYPAEPDYIYLAKNNWPYYVYGKNAIYDYAHHGNAILSKFAINFWQNINVTTNKSASRSILHSIISATNKKNKIHIICIHLGLFKRERLKQLHILIDMVNEQILPHEPVIIAGDFNDWRIHLDAHLSEKLNMQEVFTYTHGKHAKTFPAHKPMLKTDRIYFRNLDLVKAQILNQEPWKKLSDHIPLFAEFKLTGKQQ